ncbi:hypothetical protein NL676_022801 [Syzygium grande]|nr:hypothetical protein NL676_022801 [Syzygium grande]
MHREALMLLHRLVEESKSNESKADPTQKFKPEMVIEYLKPLCGTDPMLVLEFGMLVLGSCPAQTIELFRSGNLPEDLVCYHLEQHASVELLKGLNYCDVKICEEILQNSSHYTALLELYRSNSMHREALKLLHHLVEESKSNEIKAGPTQKFKPEMIIEYLKPLCATDPMLVLEFAMLVLESCPTQTIELLGSGNLPKDLVLYFLEQHASKTLKKEHARRWTPATP